MNSPNKPGKKKLGSLFLKVEAFVREAQENAQSLSKDPAPLIQKLQFLSSEELENFFLHLLQEGNEQTLLLVEAIRGKEQKLDLALAESLGHWVSPRAAILLHAMASAGPSKAVAKSIRKSIFRLKSKGLPVEEVGDRSPAVYHPPPPAASEGFLSSIDGGGNRMVWLIRPHLPQGMVAVHALISDLEGIIDFDGFETSRKRFHEYLAQFLKDVPWGIVEADLDYCHGLIVEASEIGQKQGKSPSAEFLKWQPAMGSSRKLPLKPLIYQTLKEEEAKSRLDLLERSASLFQIHFYQSWFLEEKESQKYLAFVQEAGSSRLVLTPYQKESRLMDIYRQAIDELFDESRRLLYRRRLEEMAYLLWKKGQENEARMSLAAAVGMEAGSGILAPHPFLLELVKRSLTALLEEEEKKKKRELALIVRP
jgi:hypothetical protein